jgi:GntR family transcriptional regulator
MTNLRDIQLTKLNSGQKGVPLYLLLERVLRRRIQTGRYRPDRPFPTEMALCREFSVSRITVQKALLGLEIDNLIHREQGRGTFVNPRNPLDFPFKLYGTVEDLFVLVSQTTLEIRSRELIRLEGEAAADMKLEPGTRAYRFEGFRYLVDGTRVFVRLLVPEEIGRKIDPTDLKAHFFINKIEEVSLESMKRALQVAWAETADEEMAARMGVRAGDPLMVVKRIYMTRSDRVLQVAEGRYPGKAYRSVAWLERVKS